MTFILMWYLEHINLVDFPWYMWAGMIILDLLSWAGGQK